MAKKHLILESIALANKRKNVDGVGIQFDAAGRFNATLAGKEAMVYQIMKYLPCRLIEVELPNPPKRVANAQQQAKKDPPARPKKATKLALPSYDNVVIQNEIDEAKKAIKEIADSELLRGALVAPIETDPLAPTKVEDPVEPVAELSEPAAEPVVDDGALVVPDDPAPESPEEEVAAEAPADDPAPEGADEQRGGVPEIPGEEVELDDLL